MEMRMGLRLRLGKENSETDDEDPTSEEDVVEKGHGPNDPTFEPAPAQWHRGSA